jgi:hypothetical protein
MGSTGPDASYERASARVDSARALTSSAGIYRDVFREACTVPVSIVPPSSLDVSKVGKLSAPPWARDQKLAAGVACNTTDQLSLLHVTKGVMS